MAGAVEPDFGAGGALLGIGAQQGAAQRGITGGEEQLGASAAALADLGAERNVQPVSQRFAGKQAAGVVDGHEFQLPAADGAEGGGVAHQHEGAGLARGRAPGDGDGHMDERGQVARKVASGVMGYVTRVHRAVGVGPLIRLPAPSPRGAEGGGVRAPCIPLRLAGSAWADGCCDGAMGGNGADRPLPAERR